MRAVITGATSGLGRALALEITRRSPGAALLLIGRRGDALAALAAQMPGARCTLAAIDVTDTAALRACCGRFIADGVPDLVIANAGISAGTLTEIVDDRAAFRRIVDVNLIGLMETLGPFVAPMRSARRGALVGVASVAGIRGLPGASAYSASKAAVISHLESLRVELHGSGVDVVTLAPGYVRTPMTAGNPYRMPFLIDADVFARRALDAIAGRRRFVVIPWPMSIVARILRLLPDALYDRLFARAPRKPR